MITEKQSMEWCWYGKEKGYIEISHLEKARILRDKLFDVMSAFGGFERSADGKTLYDMIQEYEAHIKELKGVFYENQD